MPTLPTSFKTRSNNIEFRKCMKTRSFYGVLESMQNWQFCPSMEYTQFCCAHSVSNWWKLTGFMAASKREKAVEVGIVSYLFPPFIRLFFGSLDAQSVDSQPSCGACLCRAEFLFDVKSELSAAGHEASTCAWLHTVMALLQQKRWSECCAQYKWR